MRTHYLDPDFRRDPKSERHCCVCQRAIKGKGIKIRIGGECCHDAVHPDDATDDNSLPALIGKDCAKKVELPEAFHIE